MFRYMCICSYCSICLYNDHILICRIIQDAITLEQRKSYIPFKLYKHEIKKIHRMHSEFMRFIFSHCNLLQCQMLNFISHWRAIYLIWYFSIRNSNVFHLKHYKQMWVSPFLRWHQWQMAHITGNALLWRHNGRGSVSNHQYHDCLLNHLFRRRSKKTSKLRVTGLCAPGEFPTQMASNAENVSIWWRHHGNVISEWLIRK